MDAVEYIRPDVLIEGVLVTPNTPQIDVTNAARVTSVLGIATVRVGFARDVDVTLGTETVAAGAGNDTFIVAGDAIGGGDDDGGNIDLTPGVAVGAGVEGHIRHLGETIMIHTVGAATENVLEVRSGGGGFGNVKALSMTHVTGAIGAGDDQAVILVNIDQDAATGGEVFALEVLSVAGSATTLAVRVGATVQVIRQLSGTFGDMDSALVNAVDERADLINPGVDTTLFVADNDTVTIGNGTMFEEIEFILAVVASGGGTMPTFEFSTGVGTWAAFSPVDGTNGMRASGVVAWDLSDIPGWLVGLAGEFLIRITRTRNVLGTSPDASLVQIAGTTEFSWDENGDLIVNSVTGATYILLDDAVLAFGDSTDFIMDWSTVQTNAGMIAAIGVGTAAQSGNFVLTALANANFDHAHAAAVDPTFIIHSASASTNEFVSFTHNQTDALINIGAGDLEISATQVRAPAGESLTFARNDGTVVMVLRNGDTMSLNNTYTVLDNILQRFGNAGDFYQKWDLNQANDAFIFATPVGSAAQSGNIIVTTVANSSSDHGLAAFAQPRLSIFSETDPTITGLEFIQIYHDGTDGNVETGTGPLRLTSNTFTVATVNAGVTGGIAFEIVTRPSTSGTANTFVATGAAHTNQTASTEAIGVNLDLSATVEFATGALALQRAVLIQAPEYAFVGASVIDDAATLYIDQEPQAGANCTITRPWAIMAASGSIGTGDLRALDGAALTISRQDGTAWATTDTGTGSTTLTINTVCSNAIQMLDNVNFRLGNAIDVSIIWSTLQATANSLMVAIGVGSAAQGGNIIITTSANINQDHDHAVAADPTLIIHSAEDPDTANDEWISFRHDGTNAQISAGSGSIIVDRVFLVPGDAAVRLAFSNDTDTGFFRASANNLAFAAAGAVIANVRGNVDGVTQFEITQRVNTSGSPTALLVTGGAHTDLALSTEAISVNLDLSATVEFATGALATQRAMLIQAPTYGFVGASTLTTTATFVVDACPTAGANATIINPICAQFGGDVSIGPTSATLFYRAIDIPAHTVTVTGGTDVTPGVGAAALALGIITLSDADAVAVNIAATLYIAGPPVGAGAGPVTINFAYAIFVDTGDVRFDGSIFSAAGVQEICDATGNLASADGATFGPAGVTLLTVRSGIVTAVS